MNFHPHEYQEIAIQRIIDHTHYGLLLDMGLGKTISTLIAIEQLMYDYFDIKKVLLIAPKKVAESTWAQETQKWSETSHLTIASVLGPEKDRIKALESDSDIYVINRENVQWLYDYYFEKPKRKFPFDMLVIDESSSFKNPQAKRFKAMRKMRPFFMEDILHIANGVRLTKADMAIGNRPFVGASEVCNGITEFVDNTNASIEKEVLGVNYNGSVGFSFYHPYEALFSDDVKRVRWKDEIVNNKYTLLYLSTAIAQQRGKYAYGYKFNAQRMKRQIIMLPSQADGTPDYTYMEQTMRIMEYDVLKTYLNSTSDD